MTIRALTAALLLALSFASISTSPAIYAKEVERGPKLTFESLRVAKDDLPENVKEVEGLPTAARQPWAFFQTPRPAALGPKQLPDALKRLLEGLGESTRKASQSFQAEGGKAGSLMWFEYADGVPKFFEAWMKSYLYGDSGSPSARYPEFLYVSEKLVVLLSFPQGDPGGEWVRSHLRRFGIPAGRWSVERGKLIGTILAAQDADRPDDGLAALDARPDLEANSSFLAYLRGELGLQKSDYEVSEKGYRAALKLHKTRVSPLSEDLRWAALDGLGTSLVFRRKLTEAVKVLKKAIALGKRNGQENWSSGLYNLACAQALRRQFKKSHAALAAAITVDPKFKEMARSDSDLEAARKRPEFKELLE